MKISCLLLVFTILLSGCSNSELITDLSNSAPEAIDAVGLEAPVEYNSIEELLEDINLEEKAAVLSNIAVSTFSNATPFSLEESMFSLESITTRDVYFCFRYKVNNDYTIEIYTTRGGNGKQRLENRIENNGDLFKDTIVNGENLYYVEGADSDWFNSYYFLMNENMVHINIPKEHAEDIETIYSHTVEEVLN